MLLQTLALMNLVTSHSKKCRLGMGYVSRWKLVLTPARNTLPQCKRSHSHHLQPAQQRLGSWVLCPSSSAPLPPHIPAAGKEDSGTYPYPMGRHRYLSKLILGHTATVVEKAGCRAKSLPASRSPLKGRIAGWMSPLSAPLRKASYSSESDQLS